MAVEHLRNLAVIAVVVINILFFAFVETMFVPKLKKLQNDGWLSGDAMALPVMDWLNSSLRTLAWLGDHAVVVFTSWARFVVPL